MCITFVQKVSNRVHVLHEVSPIPPPQVVKTLCVFVLSICKKINLLSIFFLFSYSLVKCLFYNIKPS